MKPKLRRTGVVMLVLVLAGIIGMWLAAWLQQKRAERLFLLVSALQVGESTPSQSQELAQFFTTIPNSENCDPSGCKFSLSAVNFLMNDHGDVRWFNSSFLRRLGVRPAGVWAMVTVKNGRVQNVHSEAFYESTGRAWIYARFDTIESFTPEERCEYVSLQRHPGYLVVPGHMTGAMGGAYLRTAITPEATPSQRQRARFINFGCMTGLRTCTLGSSDLAGIAGPFMPLAYEDLNADRTWAQGHAKEYEAFLGKCYSEGFGGIREARETRDGNTGKPWDIHDK